jgi:hypothetical protein
VAERRSRRCAHADERHATPGEGEMDVRGGKLREGMERGDDPVDAVHCGAALRAGGSWPHWLQPLTWRCTRSISASTSSGRVSLSKWAHALSAPFSMPGFSWMASSMCSIGVIGWCFNGSHYLHFETLPIVQFLYVRGWIAEAGGVSYRCGQLPFFLAVYMT